MLLIDLMDQEISNTWIKLFPIAVIFFVVLLLFPVSASQALEKFDKWECENENDGLPQSLELTLENGVLASFDYSSAAPSPAGDTYFMCTFSAKRNSADSKWTEKGNKTIVKFTDSATKGDKAIVTRENDTYAFEFKMSPSNCGHSTPFASKISITKGNKSCHAIDIDS